jgi:hypothetical protein
MATTHMGKLDNKAAETVKVNRWAIGLLITIAALIGFTPVTFVLGRPQLILYIFGVVATIVGLSLLFRKFQTAASFEPSFTELLLAGLNDLWLWAFIGSAWLITYGLVYWVTIQVQYVQLNADSIAFYLTVILIGCYIILVTFDEVRNTIGNLYPNTVGIRSIYYKSATHGFARLWRLQGILLLIFALFSLGHRSSISD